MALGQRHAVVAGDGADDDGATAGADRRAQPVAVPRPTDAVEDDARDAEPGIERLEAVHHGGRAPRLPAGVEHQHDGRLEPPRELAGGAGVTRRVRAVEASHHALDDREVGVGGVTGDRGDRVGAAAHPAVEGVRRPSGDDLVEARIDEVGTDLEGLDDEAAAAVGLEQAERDRRLADTAARTRDDEHAAGAETIGGGRRRRSRHSPGPPSKTGVQDRVRAGLLTLGSSYFPRLPGGTAASGLRGFRPRLQ
jgi:hypothetical protein